MTTRSSGPQEQLNRTENLIVHKSLPGVRVVDKTVCHSRTSPRVKLSVRVRRNNRNSVFSLLYSLLPLFLSSRYGYVTRNNGCNVSQPASSNVCLTSSTPLGRYGISLIKLIAVTARYVFSPSKKQYVEKYSSQETLKKREGGGKVMKNVNLN